MVHFWFELEPAAGVVHLRHRALGLVNVALRMHYLHVQRLPPDRVAWLLAYDIGQFAVLIFLTGGLVNPFGFPSWRRR